MRKLQTATALVIASLWVVAGLHCMLEFVPGLDFLSCDASHTEAGSHCEDHACQTLEAGQFVLAAPSSAQQVPAFVACLLWLEPAPEVLPSARISCAPDSLLPDLAPSWHFSERAAAPVRAPSFLI